MHLGFDITPRQRAIIDDRIAKVRAHCATLPVSDAHRFLDAECRAALAAHWNHALAPEHELAVSAYLDMAEDLRARYGRALNRRYPA